MEEQKREQARLVSNAEIIQVFEQLCGDWPTRLLLFKLKTEYGIEISEDHPPCSMQNLHKALSETLGPSLATSIIGGLYPETRRATSMRRL